MRRPSMKRGNFSNAAAVRKSSIISGSVNPGFQLAVEHIVNRSRATMESVGQAEALFFLFVVRSGFEICHALDLRFRGVFLAGRDAVRANRVNALVEA